MADDDDQGYEEEDELPPRDGVWIDDGHRLRAYLVSEAVLFRVVCPYPMDYQQADRMCAMQEGDDRCWVDYVVQEWGIDLIEVSDAHHDLDRYKLGSFEIKGFIPIQWHQTGGVGDNEIDESEVFIRVRPPGEYHPEISRLLREQMRVVEGHRE